MEHALDCTETALVLVDLQKDYCAPGFVCSSDPINWDVSSADRLCYNHVQFLENVRKWLKPDHIIWTKMEERKSLYADNAPYGKSEGFVEMCLIGTEGHETHIVKPENGEAIVVKRHCSAFSVYAEMTHPIESKGQSLDAYLKSLNIKNVAFTGVIESRCVGATIAGGSERGYKCYALTDLIGHGKETSSMEGQVTLEDEGKATRKVSDAFFAYNISSHNFLDSLK